MSPAGTSAGPLPVLVLGAGPVGVTAALLLARWGVPTVIVEAAPGRQPTGSKAICMQRDVLDVLDRVGAAEAMVARGVTWERGRTFYRGHELFQTTFPDPGRSAWPPFSNVSQSHTEACLHAQLAEQALVRVRYDARVVGLEQDDQAVTVTVRAADGTPHTVTGSHAIAADGAHSVVRQLLGVGFPGHSFDDQFLIADIRARLPFEAERRFFFDPEWNPGRQVLVHPQADSVWRIDWQVPGDFDLAADQASGRLDARVRQIVGTRPYEICWLSAYRFSQRLATTFRVGRVLLAGDAAHLMSPFGARGLNSGLQDVDNLAWKLALVRSGAAGDRLLDSYDAERRAAAEENLRVTDATMRFLVPQSEAQRARRRDILEQAVANPAARARVDSGQLAEPYWYLRSPLTTPASEEALARFPPEPGVARPPLPGTLCPDGPCRVPGRPGVNRLRSLFGSGFVVLTDPAVVAALQDALIREVSAVPVDVLALPELDVDGVLTPALEYRFGQAHVVRPDGHLAAVVAASPAAVVAAIWRACGRSGAAAGAVVDQPAVARSS